MPAPRRPPPQPANRPPHPVARLLVLATAASFASSLSASTLRLRVEGHGGRGNPLRHRGRARIGAVGGLWVAQTGFSLYVDACVPAGCHRLLDTGGTKTPAMRCEVEEARLKAIAVMDLALSVCCVVVAAVAALVLLLGVPWHGLASGRKKKGLTSGTRSAPAILPPCLAAGLQ
uniref:Uncharacterized protein n=1 Tax=Setaria italica TaxID=4555 RepID=K3ZFB9_SETIT